VRLQRGTPRRGWRGSTARWVGVAAFAVATSLTGCSLVGGVATQPSSPLSTATSSAPSGSPTVPALFSPPVLAAPPEPSSATATATPAPAALSIPWSAADCEWATATLQEDQTLDQATATRQGSGYYQTWANRWGSELYYVVTPLCSTGTQPAYNAVVDMMVWNLCGQSTHLGDGNPNDAAWNAEWAGNYARLISLGYALESAYAWPPTDAGTTALDC